MTGDAPLLTAAAPAFTLAWKALLLDHRVSDGAVRMYLVLATYARPDRPVAYPGQDTLAGQMNVSVDTLQRRGAELVAAGWIQKVRRGRGRSNLYHLRMPGAVAIAVDAAVDDVEPGTLDTADVRLLDTAELRLPYEVEQGEVETPPTPRKRGARRAATPALTPAERAADFAAWYTGYPKRVARLDAERAWRVMLDRLPSLELLMRASELTADRVMREHPETQEWRRYVPNPSTWLRRGDFLDVTAQEVGRPQVRRPCLLCGVDNPGPERCLGLAAGQITSPEDCLWAD